MYKCAFSQDCIGDKLVNVCVVSRATLPTWIDYVWGKITEDSANPNCTVEVCSTNPERTYPSPGGPETQHFANHDLSSKEVIARVINSMGGSDLVTVETSDHIFRCIILEEVKAFI